MKKNFIYNSLYQVLSLIIPIVTTPYLSRTLGVDSIGVFSYTFSIVTFFTIFAVLGTTTFGQRKIAFCRDNKEDLSRAFWEVFVFRAVITSIVLFVYFCFVFSSDGAYKNIYTVLSLNIINVIFDITWFYQGVEDFKKIVLRNTVVKLLNLISIFAFIKSSSDLRTYCIIYCGYILLGNITTWFGLNKKINFVNRINPFKDFKDIFLLFIPTVAMQVYTILDKSMIGWFTKSTYENGCYEQAEKICRIAVTIVAALATVIAPRMANLHKKHKKGEVKKTKITDLLYKGIRGGCLIAVPITFGIISITPIFVPVFFGSGYDKVSTLLPIFSFLVIAVGLANIIGISYLIPTENQNVYTFAVTISAVINFIMNLVLIPRLLSVGAAIASVFAETTGIIIQFAYCIKKEDIAFCTILKSVWKYFVSGITMLCFLVFLCKFTPANWMGLFTIIVIGATIYGIMLIVLKDSFTLETVYSIKDNIKKKMERS